MNSSYGHNKFLINTILPKTGEGIIELLYINITSRKKDGKQGERRERDRKRQGGEGVGWKVQLFEGRNEGRKEER